ncbi:MULTISPECIES: hypothetical protein [Desulfosediminicola]|uniref:hypothetical protein n=1 Tax=Desulfosediminicola TaxID=2886823 RepID=UPI0010ACDED2|nr:hypothetical protein [Desulfosediminicola ganghwensis]
MNEKISQMASEYADRPTTTVTLKMPIEFFEHVKEVAALEETEYQTIINYYVQQGLINSKAEVKRLQFAENAKKILEKHGTHQDVIDEISNMFLH